MRAWSFVCMHKIILHTGGWAHRQRVNTTFLTQKNSKVFPVLLTGFEPSTFGSPVQCSNHWANQSPRRPVITSQSSLVTSFDYISVFIRSSFPSLLFFPFKPHLKLTGSSVGSTKHVTSQMFCCLLNWMRQGSESPQWHLIFNLLGYSKLLTFSSMAVISSFHQCAPTLSSKTKANSTSKFNVPGSESLQWHLISLHLITSPCATFSVSV